MLPEKNIFRVVAVEEQWASKRRVNEKSTAEPETYSQRSRVRLHPKKFAR